VNHPKLRAILFAVVVACLCVGLLVFFSLQQRTFNERGKKSACINNLRMIDGAKQQWALGNQKTNSDVPTWSDIQRYLGRGDLEVPRCPSGGNYTLGAVSNAPTCSIPNHALPKSGN
jgi:hypothetical protein